MQQPCPLSQVLTVAEIAQVWKVAEKTVWYHLDRGHFRWRHTAGGFALVDRQSVEDYWGHAPCELSIYEKTNHGQP